MAECFELVRRLLGCSLPPEPHALWYVKQLYKSINYY